MSRNLGQGGSFLFMFTITKQFDQRNNDKCQLAQIAKVQLELHKRHPSLRVGLRDFFIFKKCSLTRYTEVYLRAEPSTVMAAPEPHYRGSFLFYQKSSCLARFLFTQKNRQCCRFFVSVQFFKMQAAIYNFPE